MVQAKNEIKAALTPLRGKTWCEPKKIKKLAQKKPLKGTGWEKW